jgi:hypothetical protein
MPLVFRSLVAGTLLCALYVIACARPVSAMTELCPTDADDVAPIGASMGAASQEYSYALFAQTPRSVDASLIADTDRGWFAWNVNVVTLAKTAAPETGPREAASGYGAESSPLAVAFPMPLVLKHAWVVRAKANAADRATDCDVPAFPTASIVAPEVDGHSAPTPSLLPLPQSPAVAAKSASAPFPVELCANAFEPARVTEAARPALPQSARDRGLGTVDSYVEIVLDEEGRLLDSWTYRSAGWEPIDLAALDAARRSSYAPATSYCRHVKSLYLFKARFRT